MVYLSLKILDDMPVEILQTFKKYYVKIDRSRNDLLENHIFFSELIQCHSMKQGNK